MVRERPVDAVLVSAQRCPSDQVDAVDRLVRGFPGIPTVIVVSRHDPAVTELILRLGASGVRRVVDVTGPTGWSRIRQALTEPTSRPAAQILARLFEALPDLPGETRAFLDLMVRMAPAAPAVRELARRLQTKPSTLMSRFSRAGLPTPKTYLAAIRLLYAAQYFEWEGMTIADVAYRLDYSSPQSFGRHLRGVLGITPTEFRRRFSFAVMCWSFPTSGSGRASGRWRI
jgi:AraC-like DNA-binding protein